MLNNIARIRRTETRLYGYHGQCRKGFSTKSPPSWIVNVKQCQKIAGGVDELPSIGNYRGGSLNGCSMIAQVLPFWNGNKKLL